jgi:uncharacterized membrane protein (DUF485 family)
MSQAAREDADVGEPVRVRTTSGSTHHYDIDWVAAESSPEFKELIARKRRFVLPATVFFLVWYTIFVLLAGYAEGFMGTRLVGGLTVGYVLALTQFVMVWGLSLMYLRKADREFEPLEERAAQRAVEGFGERAGPVSDPDGAGASRRAVIGR